MPRDKREPKSPKKRSPKSDPPKKRPPFPTIETEEVYAILALGPIRSARKRLPENVNRQIDSLISGSQRRLSAALRVDPAGVRTTVDRALERLRDDLNARAERLNSQVNNRIRRAAKRARRPLKARPAAARRSTTSPPRKASPISSSKAATSGTRRRPSNRSAAAKKASRRAKEPVDT